MDIDLLSKMIGELILANDEVALPDLGSFVAEMVPATFSDRGYTINPPYRRLVFRQRPQNDALLAGLYAKSNQISAEDAARILKDFMQGLKRELRDKKTVIFPGLGRLRATKENHFFFVADEDLDIWPEGFGLMPVSLKTNEETEEEVGEALGALSREIFRGIPEQVGNDAEVEIPERVGNDAEVEIPEQVGNDGVAAAEPVQEPVATIPTPESPVPVAAAPAPAAEPAEPAPVPVATPAVPIVEPPAAPVPVASARQRKKVPAAVWMVLIVLLFIVALIAAFLVTARINPDFIDQFLYTKEELEILHYQL